MTKSKRPGPAARVKQYAAGATQGRTKQLGKTRAHDAFSSAHARDTLSLVQAQLDEVSRELTAQIRRLVRLTAELQTLRTNVTSLLDPSN